MPVGPRVYGRLGVCGVEFTCVGAHQDPVAASSPNEAPSGPAYNLPGLLFSPLEPSSLPSYTSINDSCSSPAMSSFTQRIQNLTALTPKARALSQNDNDIVIVAAVRSAITKVRVISFVV